MKFYITTPIYYVNAKPHIGSAYTTIAADVLARHHRKTKDVFFLTGTAEHGSKMAASAAAAGQTPQEFVDANSQLFKDAWQKLNISYDDFIRTTEPRHEQAVTKFFEKLKESGKIYEGEYEGLYCVGHEAFIKESELDATGNCPDHGKPPEKVKEHNWFFKLSEYTPVLKELITTGELVVEPIGRRNEVLAFIEQGLEDISISRQNVEWAMPLPWDTAQTIYVWLDELFNYCTAVGYGADQEKFKTYWPADLHLVGKDIIKFHGIIWPALLLAIGEAIPKKVFAHGHFTVDGQKISKSLGNVIDPVELAEAYSADVVRYFLLREIPFGNDGDFSHSRLQERYNSDLANGLGNLVSRSLNMIEKFWPDFNEQPALPEGIVTIVAETQELLEQLAFDTSLTKLWQAVAWADGLVEATKPWELAKAGKDEELKEVLRQLYAVLQAVTQALEPFMPDTHAKLTALLAARPLKKPAEPLFARR